MKFRPCIDIHDGVVKQIVGGTLTDTPGPDAAGSGLVTNFVATKSAAEFASMYAADKLGGGHVIMLGAGVANVAAAKSALAAYPGGMQVGGGITAANAREFLDAGASHIIVTSYVFRDGKLDWERLAELEAAVGGPSRLVLDLSCRKRRRAAHAAHSDGTAGAAGAAAGAGAGSAAAGSDASSAAASALGSSSSAPGAESAPGPAPASEYEFEYVVVTDRWQKFTEVAVTPSTIASLASHCGEFLVHGVDVEGLRQGIEDELVALLGEHSPIPVTYAGGVRDMGDLARVARLGRGRVDVSVGSALDVFGGSLPYAKVVAWSRAQQDSGASTGAAAAPAAAAPAAGAGTA